MAVNPETEKLATGGADSVVNIWTDCTVDDDEDAVRQEVPISTLYTILFSQLNILQDLCFYFSFFSCHFFLPYFSLLDLRSYKFIILEFHFAYMLSGHLLSVSAYNECLNPKHGLMHDGMPGRGGLERSRLVKCSS